MGVNRTVNRRGDGKIRLRDDRAGREMDRLRSAGRMMTCDREPTDSVRSLQDQLPPPPASPRSVIARYLTGLRVPAPDQEETLARRWPTRNRQ